VGVCEAHRGIVATTMRERAESKAVERR
jgi:hypothetical protein